MSKRQSMRAASAFAIALVTVVLTAGQAMGATIPKFYSTVTNST